MMNNVSIYGVHGVDPMGIQDGMLAMLFEEGGAGFSEAMDSALLSTESLEETELAKGDATLTNGLALLQSEMSGLMPGLQIRTDTPVASSVPSESTVALDSPGVGTQLIAEDSGMDSDGALDQLLKQAGPLSDAQGAETLADVDVSTVMESQLETANTQQAAVTTQGQAAIAHGPKASTRTKAAAQVEATTRPEEVTADREVSMEAREPKAIDVTDELIEEWDSSHLQLDAEFEHIAANTPFSKPLQATVMENRAAVQADSIEAADNDGVKENAKADEKKIAERSFEAQVEADDVEENPADARVELSDQRTVRVVVDEELSVEVSQEGDAVDVLVEGAQDVTQDIREAAPEIADSLDEAGYQLRDFTTRDERGNPSQSTGSHNTETRSDDAETETQTVVNRGQSVNVVA